MKGGNIKQVGLYGEVEDGEIPEHDDSEDCDDAKNLFGMDSEKVSFLVGILFGGVVASICLYIIARQSADDDDGGALNLVPIGAYFYDGDSRRGLSGFLVACYDSDTDTYQSICKIDTGFGLSGSILDDIVGELEDYIIPAKGSKYSVHSLMECDIWFDPVQVWKIKYENMMLSSTSKACATKVGKYHCGIAPRFASFETYTDLNPESVTRSEILFKVYNSQSEEEKELNLDYYDHL
uniref:DNA ligase ATP-dependent C-terminal domain-containing protein n=2 Tax=Leptocylindrus danicus TaxID=163516 RepID=A0A7S2KIJ8_9STRA|mmetsp:Transcript_23208/g.34848  ORF Transcript_23208/g.34848 Transcript_23208/m.34848 type:complete len:237 (+) Transcript_23208:149-859(+)